MLLLSHLLNLFLDYVTLERQTFVLSLYISVRELLVACIFKCFTFYLYDIGKFISFQCGNLLYYMCFFQYFKNRIGSTKTFLV